MKKYIVQLSEEQRQALKHLIGSGVAPARKIMHAQILLKADSSETGPAWPDEQIQRTFGWDSRRSSGCAGALSSMA